MPWTPASGTARNGVPNLRPGCSNNCLSGKLRQYPEQIELTINTSLANFHNEKSNLRAGAKPVIQVARLHSVVHALRPRLVQG